MITYDQLLDFFESTRQLKRDGRVRYQIDEPCRWSYFLIDPDREKLIQAGRFLEARGYEVVGFLEPNPEDEPLLIYLRFDKVERHTPDSLFARNAEFYEVAAKFGLAGYDGMEVGAIDGP